MRSQLAWSRFEVLGFLLAGCALAYPFWHTARPPIEDMPQHVAMVRMLGHLHDDTLGYAAYYELSGRNPPYLAWYSVIVALSYLVGPVAAVKCAYTAPIVLTPLAVRATLRSLGRPTGVAWAASGLTWNSMLLLGFVQFLTAVPALFFGIAAAVRLLDEPTRRGRWSCGAWALLTFCCHPFASFVLLCCLAGVMVTAREGARKSLVLACTPVALAVLAWALLVGGDGQARGAPVYVAAEQARQDVPLWLGDILSGPGDELRLAAWLGLVAVGCLAAFCDPRDSEPFPNKLRVRALGAVGLGLMAAYFVLPIAVGWIWPIAPRALLLGSLLLLVALPWSRRLAPVLVTLHLTLTAVTAVQVTTAFAAFEEEEGDFETAMEHIPMRTRFALWAPRTDSAHVGWWPYTHWGGWVHAERGGGTAFSFASHPSMPVTWRSSLPPPPPIPGNGIQVHRASPARDLPWFEHVLVRGDGTALARSGLFQPVYVGREWSVWERTTPGSLRVRAPAPAWTDHR